MVVDCLVEELQATVRGLLRLVIWSYISGAVPCEVGCSHRFRHRLTSGSIATSQHWSFIASVSVVWEMEAIGLKCEYRRFRTFEL